jgi:hypothetical protein
MRNLLLSVFVTIIGCSGTGVEPVPEYPFNVYQPLTVDEKCSEIEYLWTSLDGEEHSFYPGHGDFCTKLLVIPGSTIMARCVIRDSSGEVIESGRWIESSATDLENFKNLCQGQ